MQKWKTCKVSSKNRGSKIIQGYSGKRRRFCRGLIKLPTEKNIQKITTSLFLAATLVLGSVSFAVPGIMPSAFAATENLYVSADNTLFDKSFNGPMIVEIVVADGALQDNDDSEPDVTINGNNIKMIQGADGSWYAYIANNLIFSALGDTLYGGQSDVDDVGISGESDADAVYTDTDLVVRQPKPLSENPLNAQLTQTELANGSDIRL